MITQYSAWHNQHMQKYAFQTLLFIIGAAIYKLILRIIYPWNLNNNHKPWKLTSIPSHGQV